jgi:hypothetical protein
MESSSSLRRILVYSNTYVEVYSESLHELLHTIWLSNTEDMEKEEYLQRMYDILALIEQHHPTQYLLDVLELRMPITPDLQNWLAQVYTPKLIEIGILKYAVIVPIEFITLLSMHQTVEEVNIQNDEVFTIRYFKDESNARAWLNA